jgi:hypothetical protein
VPHGETAADDGREAEQVELDAEAAVVAALGLLEQAQVVVEGLLRLPRGAVDALQLAVLLVAPPVRGRAAHEPERRDVRRGRQVRAAAEVLPGDLAVRPDVVVDRQLARAHLDVGALGGVAGRALEPDQLDLVRLAGQLGAGLVVAHHPAGEPLVVGDDVAHPGLEPLQVGRGERGVDVEVVVEAVRDRRADAELRLGEEVLDGLGEHVRGGVPQDGPAVVGVDRDRLDAVAVLGHPRQVPQVDLVDPHRDRVPAQLQAGVGADLAHRRTAGHHTRGPVEGDPEVGHAVLQARRAGGRTGRDPMLSGLPEPPRAAFYQPGSTWVSGGGAMSSASIADLG